MPPHVEVLLDGVELTSTAREAIERIGALVEIACLSDFCCSRAGGGADARLLLTSCAEPVANGKLELFLDRFDRDPCATLILSDQPVDGETAQRVAGDRAIRFASGLSADELAGRLRAMCSLRRPMDKLRRRIDQLKKLEHETSISFQQLREQVQAAGKIQRELLSSPIPLVRGLSIEVMFEPIDLTSGDLYDVHRLDEHHIGIALADATGHGLPAAFLSVYIKQLLRGKVISPSGYCILRPDEVLERLNRQVLETGLRDCHFTAALYAVYDERTQIIRWARGGVPYPILARKGHAVRQVPSRGAIVGTIEEPAFEVVELQLLTDDRLVFHTDGVDALLLGHSSGLGCSELHRTAWFRSLGSGALHDRLDELQKRQTSLTAGEWEPDDVTVVALSVCEATVQQAGVQLAPRSASMACAS
jgi:hypothetical protein